MRRLLTVLGISIALLFVVFPVHAAPTRQSTSGVTSGSSSHNDVSPPLRTLPPRPASTRPDGVKDEPQVPVQHTNQPDPVVQRQANAASTSTFAASDPTVLSSWEGISSAVSPYIPPDPNGDVGPKNYVQIVNTAFEIWAKDGTSLYGPAEISTLWTGFGGPCEFQDDGDPIVLYDHLANRWLISQFTTTSPYSECIAISTTGDPTGSWYRYDFQLSNTSLADYPKLGIWPDGYYMTANMFDTSSSSEPYQGSEAYVFDREAMLQGQPATYQMSSLQGSPMLPSDLDGTPPAAGTPNYFVSENNSYLYLYAFHVDWSNAGSSTFTQVYATPELPSTAMCDCVPEGGTTNQLDSLGDRPMYRLAYRIIGSHAYLVFDHTVDAGTSGTHQAGVRWYEIQDPGTTPSVIQQSTYGSGTLDRWMGSADIDRLGDLAIGFSTSGAQSTTIDPGIAFAGQVVGDPANTLRGDFSLLGGVATGYQYGAANTGQDRWGDYSMLKVDPTDGCTFWYTNEYYHASDSGTENWSTRIGSFRFPNCTNTPTTISVTDPTTATAGSATAVTVTIKDANGYVDTGYTGTIHFTSNDGAATLPADYTFNAADSGSHTFSARFGAAGNQTITATEVAPGTLSGSTTVTVNGAPASLAVSAPSTTYASFPFNLTVTARNSNGSTDTTYTGTVHFSSSDKAAGLPADYTFTSADAGNHTFPVSLNSAGNQTITATDTGTSSLTATSAPVTVSIASTFVSTTGSDSNSCLTSSAPCLTMQQAISKTSTGGSVTVAAGTYRESLTVAKSLTIDGAPGTIVDGSGYAHVIAIGKGATVRISNLAIENGGTTEDGGGILNQGTLAVTRGTVSGNSTAGGLGGGIENEGTLTVTDSAITGNTASSGGKGGGLYNYGDATIVNSTITSNSADTNGGGIRENGNSLNLVNDTITNNTSTSGSGGGIALLAGNPALTNTILASNTAPSGSDCDGGLQDGSGGHNLIGDGTYTITSNNVTTTSPCGPQQGVNGDLVGTSNSPVAPKLGPLQNNGGATQTEGPLAGSPVIGAGDSATCNASAVNGQDQRGYLRHASSCDIGAFEDAAQPASPALPGSGPGIVDIRPNTVSAGTTSAVTLTVDGRDFASGDTVYLGATSLPPVTLSATTLTVSVPASALTKTGVDEITVVGGATASNAAPLYLVAPSPAVTLLGYRTGSNVAVGGTGSGTPGSVSLTATGGTGAIAEYSANPTSDTSLSNAGGYIDVHLFSSSATGATIVDCDAVGSDTVYWYTGTAWQRPSDETISSSTGCATIAVSSTTTPSVSQLAGTVFAAAGSSAPTIAIVGTLDISHRGTTLVIRWHTANQTHILGFNLYAGNHRLNRGLIAVHRGHSYGFKAPFHPGPVRLQVVFRDGHTREIAPSKRRGGSRRSTRRGFSR